MSDSRSVRVAAGTGIFAVVLFAAGFVLVGVDAPMSDTSRAEVLSTYGDDATNSRQSLGLLFTALGGVCFLPFLSLLRASVTRSSRDDSILPGAAFAGGLLLVGGLVGGAVLSAAVSTGGYFDAYRVDPDLAMTGLAAGFSLNGFATMAGGVLIGSVALVAYRARLLPRWVSVVGIVVAVASVPAVFAGMWILVEALWFALVGGILAVRTPASQPERVRVGATAGARS